MNHRVPRVGIHLCVEVHLVAADSDGPFVVHRGYPTRSLWQGLEFLRGRRVCGACHLALAGVHVGFYLCAHVPETLGLSKHPEGFDSVLVALVPQGDSSERPGILIFGFFRP